MTEQTQTQPTPKRNPKKINLNYQLHLTLEGHTKAISSVQFASNGTLASACKKKKIYNIKYLF